MEGERMKPKRVLEEYLQISEPTSGAIPIRVDEYLAIAYALDIIRRAEDVEELAKFIAQKGYPSSSKTEEGWAKWLATALSNYILGKE